MSFIGEVVVGGRTIELVHGLEACPPKAPQVVGAQMAFSPLRAATEKSPEFDAICRMVARLAASRRGLWLVAIEPARARRLVIVQRTPLRGSTGPLPGDQAFRRLYRAVTHAALLIVDRLWHAESVLLTHPTGSGFPHPLRLAALEAVGDLAARDDLALERIYVDPCCAEAIEPFKDGLAEVLATRLRPETGAAQQPEPEQYDPSELRLHAIEDLRLYRIPVRPQPSPRAAPAHPDVPA